MRGLFYRLTAKFIHLQYAFGIGKRVNIYEAKFMKKVIATVNKPRPSDFGISEKISRHCYFDDGVFVYNNGEGNSYFQCELLLCENGDHIEIGSLYNTCYGIVNVGSMQLRSGVIQVFDYEVLDEDGDILEMLGYEFKSVFW